MKAKLPDENGNLLCSKCKTLKHFTEYHVCLKRCAGRQSKCKVCSARHSSVRYFANHEEEKEYVRLQAEKARARRPGFCRVSRIKSKYGMTPADYDALLKERNGGCAICRTTDTGRRSDKYFHIDHDHATGKIRGLLCTRCNPGVGYFKDSAELLRAAADYIERYSKREAA